MKKYWLPVLLLLALLVYLLNGTSAFAKQFQGWLGSLYNAAAQTAVALVFFFVVGIVLVEIFDLPLILAIAAVVALSYGLYKLWGLLTSFWSGLFGQATASGTAGAATSSLTPYANTPVNIWPTGTIFYPDGTVTLPEGYTLNSDGTLSYTAPNDGGQGD